MFPLKIVVLFLAFLLAMVTSLADLRKGEGQKKRPLTHFGIAAVGLMAAFFILSVVLEALILGTERREALEATKRALATAEAAKLAADKAAEAARRANDILIEVVRISTPIDRIELSVAFALPLDSPELADRKVEVDRALASTQKGSNFEWCTSWNRAIGAGGHFSRQGQDAVRPDHPMFPGNGGVVDEFDVEHVELAFYKEPINPQDFFWPIRLAIHSTGAKPERVDADLVLAAPFSKDDRWCLNRKFRNDVETYLLELANWSVPREAWESDTLDIQYARDIAGAQLFLNIGGQSKSSSVRSAMEVASIELKINGRPINLEREDLSKYLNKNRFQENHPYWEFKFPHDFDAVHKSGTASAGC